MKYRFSHRPIRLSLVSVHSASGAFRAACMHSNSSVKTEQPSAMSLCAVTALATYLSVKVRRQAYRRAGACYVLGSRFVNSAVVNRSMAPPGNSSPRLLSRRSVIACHHPRCLPLTLVLALCKYMLHENKFFVWERKGKAAKRQSGKAAKVQAEIYIYIGQQ